MMEQNKPLDGQLMYLDLNKVTVYGWERKKSDLVIDSLVKAIENGEDLPATRVRQINKKSYELISHDGGHNRTVACYITNTPLKVILTPEDEVMKYGRGWVGWDYKKYPRINIKDIIIKDDEGELEIIRDRPLSKERLIESIIPND